MEHYIIDKTKIWWHLLQGAVLMEIKMGSIWNVQNVNWVYICTYIGHKSMATVLGLRLQERMCCN